LPGVSRLRWYILLQVGEKEKAFFAEKRTCWILFNNGTRRIKMRRRMGAVRKSRSRRRVGLRRRKYQQPPRVRAARV
jgi:hypothetical protein